MSVMSGKKYEELEFTDDFMFGKILYHDLELCKELLELILETRIRELRYVDTQKSVDIRYDARSIRFDVYAENEEAAYDIEMQISKKEELPKRCRYYHGMMDMNLIEKGEHYKNLKKAYVIFICKYNVGGSQALPVYTFQNRCDQIPEMILGDESYTVLVNAHGVVPDNKKLQSFLRYIRTGAVEESDDDFVKRIHEKLLSAREHAEWRLEYMTLQMRDMENLEKGRAEGRAEGDANRVIQSVESLMERLALSLEDSCAALSITIESYLGAKALLKK